MNLPLLEVFSAQGMSKYFSVLSCVSVLNPLCVTWVAVCGFFMASLLTTRFNSTAAAGCLTHLCYRSHVAGSPHLDHFSELCSQKQNEILISDPLLGHQS